MLKNFLIIFIFITLFIGCSSKNENINYTNIDNNEWIFEKPIIDNHYAVVSSIDNSDKIRSINRTIVRKKSDKLLRNTLYKKVNLFLIKLNDNKDFKDFEKSSVTYINYLTKIIRTKNIFINPNDKNIYILRVVNNENFYNSFKTMINNYYIKNKTMINNFKDYNEEEFLKEIEI